MSARAGPPGHSRGARRERLYTPLWFVVALGIVYEGVLVFTPLLDPYRFRTPYAIPTFDTLFALVAIGVGYLCVERHRLRQDLESAALGVALWLTALLAVAHIAAQPDYPANPGVNPGTAPYYFLACFFAGLAGIGLAAHRGARRFELTDRGRFWISAGVFAFGLVLALTVPRVRPLLPSLVMPPGKFTPFTSWSAALVLAAFAAWVFWAGRRRFFRRDGDAFASYPLLAAALWTVGLMGLLTSGGYRYSIPWYLAGLSRPLGVGLIFVGLLREQVWLYREARARQRDLEGLHGAGQALVRSLDAREIVQTITTKAVEVLAADGAVLFRLDTGSRTAGPVSRAGVITDRFVRGLVLPVEREDVGPAAAPRRLEALAVPEAVRARMRQDGLETAMTMPLVVQSGETFGILAVFFRGQREFRDADVELLSAFGAQASVALENARAFEQLAVKATHDATLQDFGRRLLEATAESPILDDAARTTRDLLGADSVGVFLFDPTSSELRLEAGVGWQPETVGRVTVTPSNQSFAGYTFVNKEVVQVEDLAGETRFQIPLHLTAHGIRAGINVPLGVRDQPVGVLTACYRTPHRFSDEEGRALTSLAHQTALALDKVRLYAELQRNLERLQETQAQLIQADKLKALGTLLSGMAHELNNPLSTVLLSAQLLKRRHALSEPVRAQMDVIEQECERAARIIRELLVFARRRPPERKPIDVNDVVRSALELQTPEFDLRGLRVVADLAAVPAIQGDAHQLQQVLLNLFSNATHAMKGTLEKVLSVRSREADGTVVVDVEDTGPGIAAEHLTRVFDPFFTTKGVGEGTGLGLSLSIGIVEAHGGSMHVENRPAGGAHVTLRLPASDEVEAGEAAPNLQAPSERRGHILLVEDETQLRAVLHEVLTGIGHTVDEAATGEAAMLGLDRKRYDVILLDLKLPDIDGKVIWRWLHARHPETAARVMFMTGDTMSPETEAFLKEAGCPVLNKPLAIDQVAHMVGQFLARP
jgi:signal transduction histidine kinase